MAKQDVDCITLDLFASAPKVGRPRSNPLTREQQIRINKRNQLKRDRSSGLKRVELKLHSDLISALEDVANQRNITRGQLIQQILDDHINKQLIDKK
ncbi:LexA regulated protein [Phocoenobacter skyensis]|uniref:LexA regulated protein n=1 Tax=Phocoenobacter skyensis TaxID=97481 RepID=A0A1H8A9W1_9PAST|nr:LexA regulated protein [Pasteurella skyensis]MDP8080409.1 LexA regulated protein [Pasteurella skyensis]MDP8086399.1 LexA regulated protein [Pasteurella skyensis]MDP8163188.1 LexA regulated protein [Pasteurella skyensis]MDP8170158.1 LexA regulated protein [Pasteurella skyensis]MDP8173337.1 LexA regulated protein [Pasteurella skyensis]